MKYIHVYTLLLLLVFHTSCGHSQTNAPNDTTKPGKAGYSESPLKEVATPKVPMGMVRNVRQASNGDILIASYSAVFRYDARLPDGQGISFTNITSKIPSPSFWDVLEDRKGNLWFGTRDSGVYLLPSGQTTFQHFTTKQGLASNYGATHLYEDKAGTIWIGTARGISRYDARLNDLVGQGKSLPAGQAGFQNFTTEDGLPNNDINTIMEDKTGKLWFGTRGDLCVYDGKTFTVLRNKKGEAFYNVWGITEDRKGNIWFGGSIIKDKKGSTLFLEDGLWRYDGSTITKVSQKSAYAIIEDKKGNIWTTGADGPPRVGQVWSLSRYDAKSLYSKKPTVTEIKSQSGMLLGILEDGKGNIWFGSGAGVYRYDGQTITDFKSAADQIIHIANRKITSPLLINKILSYER
jgi:ligand-binding sensor domain-containing protein